MDGLARPRFSHSAGLRGRASTRRPPWLRGSSPRRILSPRPTEKMFGSRFSLPATACMHALDLGPSALDGAFFAVGTTNVDFGPHIRELLALGKDDGRIFLSMGPDDI